MLKEKIRTGKPVLVGSIWDPLSAKIYEKAGFDVLNVGSYTVAGSLGVPDVGLVTWMDYVEMTRKVVSLSRLPVMVDGEQGFGYENLTTYIFGELEHVGASAVRIDDSGGEVKCPFLGVPSVSPVQETVNKIKAVARQRKSERFMIIARSFATYRHGFNETLDRLKAFRDAGAEVLYPSTYNLEDLERCKKAFPDTPLCVNLVPYGKKKFRGMTVKQAAELGYQVIFFSTTIFFKAAKAALEAASKLVQTGDPMQVWPEGFWEEQFLDLVEFRKWTE